MQTGYGEPKQDSFNATTTGANAEGSLGSEKDPVKTINQKDNDVLMDIDETFAPVNLEELMQVDTNVNSNSELIENSEFKVLKPITHNHFVLDLFQSKSFKDKNVLNEYTYKIVPKYPTKDIPMNNILLHLKALFMSLIDEMRKEYGGAAKIRVYIWHQELKTQIVIPPQFLDKISSDILITDIENHLYSAGFIPADENLQINVAIAHVDLSGGARRKILNARLDAYYKTSMVSIRNDDNLCLPRAIAVGLAYIDKAKPVKLRRMKNTYSQLKDNRGTKQTNAAKDVLETAGLTTEIGTIMQLPFYESAFKVSIGVFSAEHNNTIIYPGSSKYQDQMFLYYSEEDGKGHFDFVSSPKGMLSTPYFCIHCLKGFSSAYKHSCAYWCNVCGKPDCSEKASSKKCTDCNRTCRSQQCYDFHKERKKTGRGINKGLELHSICEQFWECPDCQVTLKRSDRAIEFHKCGEMKCNVCKQFHMDSNHLCYMRAIESESNFDKFIFYDFECHQESGIHKPNFLVAQSICSKCENEQVTELSKCSSCGSRCENCNSFNKKKNEFVRNPCNSCGHRQVIFEGERTSKDFCQWLIAPQHKNFTVIAHNARAYDAYFLYDYMIQNSILPDPIIFSGSKIMFMKIERGLNMRILDSLNFLPMPLAKIPKSFGIEEKKKGFFPHYFNIPENQRVILPHLPDSKYYDPENMSKERREEFYQWYEKNYNREFNFQKEMREYCISDVDILLNGCWKFRSLVMEATGVVSFEDIMMGKTMGNSVDPLYFLTIASVCMGIFRSKFLRETWSILTKEEAEKNPNCDHTFDCNCNWLEGRKLNGQSEIEAFVNGVWVNCKQLAVHKKKFVKSPIGLIPPHGYSGSTNHSKQAMQWLYFLEKKYRQDGIDIDIQHARSDAGEKSILFTSPDARKTVYKVDGYFEYNGEKYVCEFNGCNWHGCRECYPRDRERTLEHGKTLEQRYKDTLLKEKRLKSMGYNVITIWSHSFADMVKSDENLAAFINSLGLRDPINIRDAYYGGRTNAIVLHYIFKKGEKGYYIDFTSLYPYILKYYKFPIGHPTRICTNFDPTCIETCTGGCIYSNCKGFHVGLKYFGVIKATFLPPTDLLHPVLPVRCNGKLKFPLCLTCAENGDVDSDCNCTDSQRMFEGTYCSPEVEVALNMGYKVIQYHEVLHWDETTIYDANYQLGGLFTDYINTFLKIKQEASGFPSHVVTEEDKDQYIQDYYNHEGVLLDKCSIVKNAGLRSISKLALNSFYGKFGQRTNMQKTKFIKDSGDFLCTMNDVTKKIGNFHLMNENTIEIEYEYASEFEPMSLNTNPVFAAFCTSWGRIKLWSEMNKLGDRVIYHDTDSIIFTVDENKSQYIPPLGDYLGDFTNELTCKEVDCTLRACEGHWIIEFVSCGPKNYAYKLNSGQVYCKVRGFTLNYQASKVLNFESMKDSLFSWKRKEPSEKVVIRNEIRRNKRTCTVYNKVIEKHYNVVYDKRRILPDFKTVPFGYKF